MRRASRTVHQSYHEETRHESRSGLLDLPSTPWTQRREGKGHTVAMSDIYLVQRLELELVGIDGAVGRGDPQY
jgi:hypothetical protein